MDHKVYVYNLQNFNLKFTYDHSSSFILAFDFSLDNTIIQCDSGDNERFYFETEDGSSISSSTTMDCQFYDSTCMFSWDLQRIWTESSSNIPSCTHRSHDSRFLAVGFNDGSIKLYNPDSSKVSPVF